MSYSIKSPYYIGHGAKPDEIVQHTGEQAVRPAKADLDLGATMYMRNEDMVDLGTHRPSIRAV